MRKIYLFDWGNTLMRDFPDAQGPMCTWPRVEIMPGADLLLQELAQIADCYIATNAKDSSKGEIIKALERVGLNVWIKDVFCFKELGVSKPSKEYFDNILHKLNVSANEVIMIGDNLETDVEGVARWGINMVLYDPSNKYTDYTGRKIAYFPDLLKTEYNED